MTEISNQHSKNISIGKFASNKSCHCVDFTFSIDDVNIGLDRGQHRYCVDRGTRGFP